jgi:peptidoglycan-associated lipoprotein
MGRKIIPWLLCAAMVTMMGCANKGMERPLDANTVSLDETGVRSPGVSTPPLQSIYYNFDSAGIRKDQVPTMERNADYIKKMDGKIRLEGNTDPRGTGEYNMALGGRRAISAMKFLVYLGIPEDKFEIVSFGEENLLTDDPANYVLDRRTDFVAQ